VEDEDVGVHEHEASEAPKARPTTRATESATEHGLLGLQRQAGNAAVAQHLQRAEFEDVEGQQPAQSPVGPVPPAEEAPGAQAPSGEVVTGPAGAEQAPSAQAPAGPSAVEQAPSAQAPAGEAAAEQAQAPPSAGEAAAEEFQSEQSLGPSGALSAGDAGALEELHGS
jgi:hypothetical protein